MNLFCYYKRLEFFQFNDLTPEVDKLRVRKQRLPAKDVGIQSNLPMFDFSSSNSSLGTTVAAKESSFTSCYSGGSNSSSFNERPATRVEEVTSID